MVIKLNPYANDQKIAYIIKKVLCKVLGFVYKQPI